MGPRGADEWGTILPGTLNLAEKDQVVLLRASAGPADSFCCKHTTSLIPETQRNREANERCELVAWWCAYLPPFLVRYDIPTPLQGHTALASLMYPWEPVDEVEIILAY